MSARTVAHLAASLAKVPKGTEALRTVWGSGGAVQAWWSETPLSAGAAVCVSGPLDSVYHLLVATVSQGDQLVLSRWL